MPCIYADHFSVEQCRANPHQIYVFGDNLDRHGTGGQAIIRYEPNVFGVPTKRYASMKQGAFFSDAPCEREHVLQALRDLYVIGRRHTLVFPSKGLGTGMAKMPEKSPLLYAEMCSILRNHFKIENVRK